MASTLIGAVRSYASWLRDNKRLVLDTLTEEFMFRLAHGHCPLAEIQAADIALGGWVSLNAGIGNTDGVTKDVTVQALDVLMFEFYKLCRPLTSSGIYMFFDTSDDADVVASELRLWGRTAYVGVPRLIFRGWVVRVTVELDPRLWKQFPFPGEFGRDNLDSDSDASSSAEERSDVSDDGGVVECVDSASDSSDGLGGDHF